MIEARPHRMLWSYHYARRADLDDVFRKFGHRPIVFADSGGYSALTQGVAIDIDEYAEWLLENRTRFEVYANLDSIGDHKATFRNQELLERRGLRPLPVFHYGSPMNYLDRYADAGHDYIALGGLVGGSPERLMPWLVQAFLWARKREEAGKGRVVFHGFGITSVPILASLPWYTVDSTSWNSGARFGTIKLFDPMVGAWRSMEMFNTESVIAASGLLGHYGFTTEHFLARETYHFTQAVALSARSWRAFEDYCRRRHGPITHPGSPDGLHLYMAATSRTDLTAANLALTPGVHIYLADGSQNNHIAANLALTPAQEADPDV